jgi:fermentation-respiration switch protein FrsA (DUF1100 family)
MHENVERNEETAGGSERSFGLVMAAFLAIVGLLPLSHGSRSLHWWALGLAAAFALAAFFWTAPLKPLNWLWFRLGHLLHRLVSPLVIGLVFFFAVLPTALILRALGKDHLRLRRDPTSASYWVERNPAQADPDSMKNQF